MTLKKVPRTAKRSGESGGRTSFIEGLLKSYRESLKNGTAKLTASDFIRLMSMEQELADRKQIREIRVTWVQPKETESGS